MKFTSKVSFFTLKEVICLAERNKPQEVQVHVFHAGHAGIRYLGKMPISEAHNKRQQGGGQVDFIGEQAFRVLKQRVSVPTRR